MSDTSQRDNRTALMYAAENADPTLILTLLEKGADKQIKDTKGNEVIWYLEENDKVSDRQRLVLEQRFKP